MRQRKSSDRWRRLAASLGTAAVLACAGSPSPLEPRGRGADDLAGLGWLSIVAGTAVFAVSVALLVWAAVVRGRRADRRGTFAEHGPVTASDGQGWILWGGLLVPAAILALLFAATLGVLRAFPHARGERAVQVHVIARQWWWDVRYQGATPSENVATANEIHIPVGEPVQIMLSTADVIHSFWVPQLNGKMDVIPGRRTMIQLHAASAGRYRGECSEFCGLQHAHMAFTVVAEPRDRFDAWLARERAPASEPPDSLRRGRDVFLASACVFCHTVRGTSAAGATAPDLTHIGSRLTIAAGTRPNTPGHLAAWIAGAQSIKPGSRMPSFTQYDPETLRKLAGYLASLR